MRCFHCFVTNKTLTDLKVKPLDKGSHSLSLEEIVLVKKEQDLLRERKNYKKGLCVLERENEKVVFFLERENDCHDYYLLELGVRKK